MPVAALELKSSTRPPARPRACLHCGSPLARDEAGDYCCRGCAEVHALLSGQGLLRYYDLRTGRGVPAREREASKSDDKWLDIAEATLSSRSGLALLPLDVEGIHCSGCVWLIDQLFQRTGSTGSARTNPATGTLDLYVAQDFDLRGFVADVEALGYRVGPRRPREKTSQSLLVRLGISVALAMNAMIFSISIYAGLDGGRLHTAFHLFTFGLALVSLAVGGSVFIAGAARGLVRGVLHLDLPIAVGLVLGFAGSTWSLYATAGRDAYFDTLTVFIALMLLGRFLRERVLEKNRTQLLADTGPLDLLVRRIQGRDGSERVEVTSVTTIKPGDRLLIAPGDVTPVDADLVSDRATLSHDWITGESATTDARTLDRVTAGAANAGAQAIELTARTSFADSPLLELLRAPRPADRYGDALAPFEARLARYWVVSVLVVAALGMVAWTLATGDLTRAIGVTVGVLVITCPCAFGIATPLANEIVLGGLRRAGLLVRSSTFLERAVDVRRVIFDKTGTLTTGRVKVAAGALDALSEKDARVFGNLAARSSHPKSAAIRTSLPGDATRYLDLAAREIPGAGLETELDGHTYRLGDPRWVAPGSVTVGDVALSKDDRTLAIVTTEEELRADAAREVRALHGAGLDVWMLTGDKRPRALEAAAATGIPESKVLSDRTPEDKARDLAELDHGDALYVGDGINDALAVRVATCSGTPAAGRTFLAARTDFYLLGEGLTPLRIALQGARALRKTTRRNLRVSLGYNALAVGLAWAGLMSPLLCAVMMPLSSIVSITIVVRSLARKEAAWRS